MIDDTVKNATDKIEEILRDAMTPTYYVSVHGGEFDDGPVVLGQEANTERYIESEHKTKVPDNLIVFMFTPAGYCAVSNEESEYADLKKLVKIDPLWYSTNMPRDFWGDNVQLYIPGQYIANNPLAFDKNNDYFKIFELLGFINKDGKKLRRATKAGFNLLKDKSKIVPPAVSKYNLRPIETGYARRRWKYGLVTMQYLLNTISQRIPNVDLRSGTRRKAVVYINCCNPLSDRLYVPENPKSMNDMGMNYPYVRNKVKLENNAINKMRMLIKAYKQKYPDEKSYFHRNHYTDFVILNNNNREIGPDGNVEREIGPDGKILYRIANDEMNHRPYNEAVSRMKSRRKRKQNNNSLVDLYNTKVGKQLYRRGGKKRRTRKKRTRKRKY